VAGLGDGRGISEANPRWELQTPAAPKSCHNELLASVRITEADTPFSAGGLSQNGLVRAQDSRFGCVRTVSKPYVLWLVELAFERKQAPQVVGNIKK
jgi:hypothetical protein